MKDWNWNLKVKASNRFGWEWEELGSGWSCWNLELESFGLGFGGLEQQIGRRWNTAGGSRSRQQITAVGSGQIEVANHGRSRQQEVGRSRQQDVGSRSWRGWLAMACVCVDGWVAAMCALCSVETGEWSGCGVAVGLCVWVCELWILWFCFCVWELRVIDS